MNNTILTIIFVILTPFLVYVLFRIGSSAIFRSWFESKREFEKKGGENGRKDKTQVG